jgi:plastocyanin domain-containing protein
MNGDIQEITINLKDTGYDPDAIRVKKGIPVKVTLKTNRTYSCIQAFVIPSLNIQKVLTPTDTESFTFTPKEAGQIDFTCSMGMYNGSFIVE